MKTILKNYAALLSAVDRWFARSVSQFPHEIQCAKACSDCCRGLFDITLLDAWYLKMGFDLLDDDVKRRVTRKAELRLKALQMLWPELSTPHILNIRPEEEWEELMPDEDETPCPLLSEAGQCLVYDYRPMTCRLHGIPLVDVSGEVFHDEWCSLNFIVENPLLKQELQWNFSSCFDTEVALFQQFTSKIFQECIKELDTFIPLAILTDFDSVDWRGWWSEHATTVLRTDFPARFSTDPQTV